MQAETHDSIEDARTALQLYELHQRLEAEGTWEERLEDVYREGRLTVRFHFRGSLLLLTLLLANAKNFKVPDQSAAPPQTDSIGLGPGAVVATTSS